MNFSEALDALKQGKKLRREGWNGKGLYVELERHPDAFYIKITEPFFMIVNIGNHSINTWVPSVSDLLAVDWEVAS